MIRTRSVRNALRSRGIDGLLVTDLSNIRYLSSFSGSSGCLIISGKERIFFTDGRYEEQAKKEIKGFDIFIDEKDILRAAIESIRSLGIKTLGFESSLSYASYRRLLRNGFRIKAISYLVEDIRKIKDLHELRLTNTAVKRAEMAFRKVKPFIKKGISEKQIARMLEDKLRDKGCSSLPFDIIVASGSNSALPHAKPSHRKIRGGDFILIDWGGEAGGYFSDMSRTFLVQGKDMSRKKEIYETVLKAHAAAIHAVREGKHTRLVDKAARDVIKKSGYEDCFGHGTGHGVGLDVHELPRVSRSGGETVKKNMIFTIEPGVYIPGLGGVRIEDMVLAKKNGCTVMTGLPRKFEIIV
jgi:Xaa-Pro aminopeptidase